MWRARHHPAFHARTLHLSASEFLPALVISFWGQFMSRRLRRSFTALWFVGVAHVCACPARADPAVLSTDPSVDGGVSVGVDGFGAFGRFSFSGGAQGPHVGAATFNPVGPLSADNTVADSAIAIRIGAAGARQFLHSGQVGTGLDSGPNPLPGAGFNNASSNPVVTVVGNTATSSFAHAGLSFNVTQTIEPTFSGTSRLGSRLNQQYAITNTTAAALSFEIIRYVDGDLFFQSNQEQDGGGRLQVGAQEALFETSDAASTAEEVTFFGIAASGGAAPLTGRFEISPWGRSSASGDETTQPTNIIQGRALRDAVQGDGADEDEFIDLDNGYDVTLALRTNFDLAPGASATYTTATTWGNGLVPEPCAALAFVLTLPMSRPRRRAARPRASCSGLLR